MNFHEISNCYVKNIFKAIFSTIVIAAPWLAIKIAIIYFVPLTLKWQNYAMDAYTFLIQVFFMEHFYRCVAMSVRDGNIKWVNRIIPANYGKVLSVYLIILLICRGIPTLYVYLMPAGGTVYYAGAWVVGYFIFANQFILYLCFIAYGMNEKHPFIQGLKEAYTLAGNNKLFYFICTIILYPLSAVPFAGAALGIFVLMFIEFLRGFLYRESFYCKEESQDDYYYDYNNGY